jgi:hypothetical protein
MKLSPTNRSRLLGIAVGATLALAACQGGHTAAPATTGKTTSTTRAAAPTTTTPTTTPAPSTTTSAGTSTTVTSPAGPTTTTATFAAVTGTYSGGTADAGNLYIRADGASRYRYPDEDACQCSTAAAPIAYVDFSLTSLVPTGSVHGDYRATGRITAESDPTTGSQVAGPIGSSVTVTIAPPGSAVVSFLLPNNVLMLPNSGA